MKAGRALIGIFQTMRVKNLMGGQWPIKKKLDSFTLETSKNTSSAIFCATSAWGLSYMQLYYSDLLRWGFTTPQHSKHRNTSLTLEKTVIFIVYCIFQISNTDSVSC